jgi:hypothetical protein
MERLSDSADVGLEREKREDEAEASGRAACEEFGLFPLEDAGVAQSSHSVSCCGDWKLSAATISSIWSLASISMLQFG